MSEIQQRFEESKLPRHKVELHIHLDASVRVETVWELSQKKGIFLAKSIAELRDMCHMNEPSTLQNYLKLIAMYLPVINGDADAIERIAYEFCEDAVKEGLLYVEVRYSPHMMSSTHGRVADKDGSRTLSLSNVVECVSRGLEKGSRDFGIKIRSILCSMKGRQGWATDVLKLCQEYRDRGIVGMDIAGQDTLEYDTSKEVVECFKLAAENGIHRTVHAGKDGPAAQVKFAVDELLAERIGHGYSVVNDHSVYSQCLENGIHFETCPYSSLLTGGLMDSGIKHPTVRFAEDGANFSISRDGTTIMQNTLSDDYELLRRMGLTDVHFTRANFNAVHSSFLPEKEKKDLLQELREAYAIDRE